MNDAVLGANHFVSGAAERLASPRVIEPGLFAFIVLVGAILITLALVTLQRVVIRRTDSTAIAADRLHYTADLATNLLVLAALVLTARLGIAWIDPVAAERGEGELRRIVTLPAVGLKNIEWNPRRDQLLVYFDRPSQAADGSQLLGVYLVHLDKVKPDEIPQTDVEDGGEAKPKQEWLERLFNEGGIHTLWFSPQGRFVTWSSSEAVFFRRPDALGEEPTVVEIQLETGEYLDIKGVTWHDSERYLGITAGPRAFVYDVQAKELTEVVNLEDSMPEGGFLAEPVWVKDELFFTKFEDVTAATEEKLLKPVLIQKK